MVQLTCARSTIRNDGKTHLKKGTILLARTSAVRKP